MGLRTKPALVAAVLGSLLTMSAVSRGEVLVDNLTLYGGDAYQEFGWFIGTVGTWVVDESPATSFTTISACHLDAIDFGVTWWEGPNLVNVWLAADVGYMPGGPSAWSFLGTLSDLPSLGTNNSNTKITSLVFDPAANRDLDANTSYWVILSRGSTDTLASWNINLFGETGTMRYSPVFGWYGSADCGAFRVIASERSGEVTPAPAVPLPASSLGGLALLGLLSAAKLRKPATNPA